MIGDFSFLKGNIVPIILNVIHDKPDKQDYSNSIWQTVCSKVEGYEIKKSTIYTYLKRLEEQQFIREIWGDAPQGGRRKYYQLTNEGEAEFQRYVANWNKQKETMDALVDATPVENALADMQADPKLVLGKIPNSTKRKPRAVKNDALAEQELLAERISQLRQAKTAPAAIVNEPVVEASTATIVAKTANVSEIEVVETATVSKPVITNQPEDNSQIQLGNSPILDQYDRNHEQETSSTTVVEPRTEVSFDVQQHSQEEFLEIFNKHIAELESTKIDSEPQQNRKDYLFGIVADQISDEQDVEPEEDELSEITNQQQQTTTIVHMQLDSIAEQLSKQGVVLRIYNKATSNYKRKVVVPVAKNVTMSSWIGYLATFLLMALLAFSTSKNNTLVPIVIMAGVLLLAPIAITIWANMSESINSLTVNCKMFTMVSLLAWLGLSLLIFSINLLFMGTKLSDIAVVVTKILAPIALLTFPLFMALVLSVIQHKFIESK